MIRFYLNNQLVETECPSGMVLVDFIREKRSLVGTKIGCREGDCGACTILVGSLINGQLKYKSITSCITPLGNVNGKHVVTVEGINLEDSLSPAQEEMVNQCGTQCGFCTVGFVMSLTGYGLECENPTPEMAISAIDGNICRCTGYKPIERAAAALAKRLEAKPKDNSMAWLVENGFLPEYFIDVQNSLESLSITTRESTGRPVGGGTDLYVQRPEDFSEQDVLHASDQPELHGIEEVDGKIIIGAATTPTDIMESELMQGHFPNLFTHMKLVSSTPIRNIGTLAGNFVNASPIGDLTAMFIALNASINVVGMASRTIPLKEFYLGYKDIDLDVEEHIQTIQFDVPSVGHYFNFEKVSKRTYLDIASVNTGFSAVVVEGIVKQASISAGGVGPTPMRLNKASDHMIGKRISEDLLVEVQELANAEVAPISDVRGTEAYKRLQLKQLLFAHFYELFPTEIGEEANV